MRPGTFSFGGGRLARAGTGLLSPTASNAPDLNETHPAAWNVPGRWGPHVPHAPAGPVRRQRLLIQARRCPNSESVGL